MSLELVGLLVWAVFQIGTVIAMTWYFVLGSLKDNGDQVMIGFLLFAIFIVGLLGSAMLYDFEVSKGNFSDSRVMIDRAFACVKFAFPVGLLISFFCSLLIAVIKRSGYRTEWAIFTAMLSVAVCFAMYVPRLAASAG